LLVRPLCIMRKARHHRDLTEMRQGYRIMYRKLYMEAAMKKDKNIMIRVSKETHTALKKKAADEGTTMSKIIRQFVERYLTDELELRDTG
jgi:predicted DNA binding CopG/RHH family protein